VSELTIENSNYTLVGGTYSGNVLITPRLVGAQAVDGATRRYDGTMNVAGSLLTLGGILEGDSVTLSGSALMAGKDVGTHALTDTGSLALSSGNYALTGAAGEVAVTPLPVQVAGANSRPYDGTTAAAANLLRVANAASGETVTLGGSATLVAKNAGLEAISDLSGLTLSDSNYTLAGASAIGGVTVTPIPLNVTVQTGATRPFNGRSEVATDLLQLDGILPGDHVGLSGNGTLAAPFGTVPATGLGSLAIDNSDYRLAGISGTVDIQAPTTVSNEPIISQAQRTDPPSVAQVLSVAQAGSESRAVLNPMPPNVVSSPLRLSAAFGDGVPLTLISSPGPGEHSESVTLAQARDMVSAPSGGPSSGDREVRVPVSRNSLAEIVNGGLKLPGGVDQLLFVVKGN
jgi:hypothetical protein